MNFKVISSSEETLGEAKQILVQHPYLFSKPVIEFPVTLFRWVQKIPFCWSKLWSFFFLYSIIISMRRFSGLTENTVVFLMQAILQQLSVLLIYYLHFSLFGNESFFFVSSYSLNSLYLQYILVNFISLYCF